MAVISDKPTDLGGAKEIARLKARYKVLEAKKAVAFPLAKYYWENSYKKNGAIVPAEKWTTATQEGVNGTWRVANAPDTVFIKANLPPNCNNFYPDGKEKPAQSYVYHSFNAGTGVYTKYTQSSPARKTKIVDPNRLYASELFSKDAKARHEYMQTQYKTFLPAALSEVENKLNALGVSDSEFIGNSSGGGEDGDPGGPPRPGRRRRRRRNRRRRQKNNFDTNVGMVAEAYFRQDAGFSKLANLMTGGSLPHDVDNANRLWKDAQSNKGMIWLYVPKNPAKDTYTLVPTAAEGKEEYVQYVFQFHYNPPTIQMAWSGNPSVDVTMETSGTEKFNLMSSSTTSAISFDIILNRMYDFQYYGTDGVLKEGYRIGDNGHPYIAKSPETNEQKDIYKKGTMYDVEYLLGTALGFKLRTRLRKKTTDIGYLTGRPVDLHLGNNLRYWGYITSINLEHRIFDERMVPIFSTLHIDFARVPDYGGKNK